MTSRFTRLSGRDETSCKFSSRAKSLWNLQRQPQNAPEPLTPNRFQLSIAAIARSVDTEYRWIQTTNQTTQPRSCEYSILPLCWVKWSKWRLTFRNASELWNSVLCWGFSEDCKWNLNSVWIGLHHIGNDVKYCSMNFNDIKKRGNSGNLRNWPVQHQWHGLGTCEQQAAWSAAP